MGGVRTWVFRCWVEVLAIQIVLAVLAGQAARADYAVDWFKISGGGGVSTAGDFSLSGTIGQADTGNMVGGDFEIQAGFWLFTRPQVQSAPRLFAAASGTNTLVVSWQDPSGRFVLEENPGLDASTWIRVAVSPTEKDSVWQVAVPFAPGARFYRLRQE